MDQVHSLLFIWVVIIEQNKKQHSKLYVTPKLSHGYACMCSCDANVCTCSHGAEASTCSWGANMCVCVHMVLKHACVYMVLEHARVHMVLT